MSDPLHILLVEDAVADAELAQREIRKAVKDCDFQRVDSRKDFLEALETFQPDVILSDYNMPNFDGLKALELALDLAPLTPFIIWTGSLSEDTAVECMKAGATNYIIKENIQRLGPAIIRALGERRLKLEAAQAEERLRESEERFRSLIENGLDNISLLTRDGVLLWENPAVNRTLGYGQDVFIGRNIFELMHPEDAGWTQKRFTDLLKYPGKHENGTFRLRHVNGTWRWIEAIATNLLDDPSVQAMVINYRDITERKEAEIELQKKNDDLALLNAINEAVIRGESLNSIMDLLNKELKRIFSCEGSTIYMLDPQEQFLTMQQYKLSSTITKKIEGLIGGTIPLVRIPVREGGYFQNVLRSKRGVITSDPHEIQKWMEEFTDSTFLGPAARSVIRKLIPQIYKVLNIQSTITVPLVSNERTIGLMDLSSPGLFAENDLERIEGIARQLTVAIQRQQANERVQRSEEFLQSVQNALTSSIAILDKDGVIVRVNSAWRKFGELNGFRHPQQGIGLNYLDVCDSATGPYSDEAPLVAQAIRDVIAGRISDAQIEYPCHSPDEERWFVLRITKFDDGERTWVVLAHENITERKKAELQIAYQVHLLSSVHDAVLSFDKDFVLTSWNLAAEHMYGWKAEEVIGKPGYDVLVNESFDMTQDEAIEQLRTTGMFHAEVVHFRKDGTKLFVDAQASSLNDLNGNQVYVAVNRDISERKASENALRESEEKYRLLFESNPLPMWIFDLETLRFLKVNEAAVSHYGYSVDEFMAMTIRDIRPSADIPKLIQTVSRVSDGIDKAGVWEHIKKDGSLILAEIIVHAVEFDGRRAMLVLVNDITERTRAEQSLQKSEARYRGLFEDTPVAIWEEDFSELKKHLVLLKQQGITDFRAYFASHPDELIEYARLISVIDVNNFALQMYEADDKEELIKETERALTRGELEHVLEDFIAIADGKTSHGWEGADETLTGKPLEISLTWSVVPGYEEDYSRVIVTTVDITERKQAEERLRSSEERFRQLADNIQEVFWMTDATSGEEIYISPASEKIWGQSVESMLYSPDAFINSILPEDRPTVMSALQEQRNGKNTDMEYRILRPDGSVSWIWDRAFPVFDDSGKVVRLAGIAADITDRKQAEDALRESEEKYRILFDSNPLPMWIYDLETLRFLKVNDAAINHYGYSENEFLSMTIKDIRPANDIPRLLENVEHVGGGIDEAGIWTHLKKDGSSIKVEIISHVVVFDGRRSELVLANDVTERLQAEDALRDSQVRFAGVVNTAMDAVISVNSDQRIILFNPAAERMFGCEASTALGQPIERFIPDRYRSAHKKHIINFGQTGTTNRAMGHLGTLSGLRCDGTEFPIEASISHIEVGEQHLYTVILRDITERKQSEKEIQRHLAELEALYENGLAVGQLLEPREIGERIINTFNRYLSWHHVTIRLLKSASDELDLVAYSLPHLDETERGKAEQNFVKRISKVGQGMSGWVVQTGQSIRTGNVHEYPQYVEIYGGIRSGLYMPLAIGKFVIGVISVESEEPDAFNEQDERLLATLANQAAVAFENARLYQSIQQELAERKRMELALRSSETHYRELADSITDVFFELDQDMRYTHWNKASEVLTGVVEKDAIGKRLEEIFDISIEQARIGAIYESVLTNRSPRTFETIFLLNNEKHSFEVNAYPSTRGVAVVAKDVTERKRLEILQQKRFELMEYSAHNTLDELMRKTMDEISELTSSEIGFFHLIEDDQNALGEQIWSTETLKHFTVPVSEGRHRPVEQAGAWADAVRQRRPLIQNEFESLPHRMGVPQGHARIVREMVIPVIRNEKILAVLGVGNKPQDYTQQDLEIAGRLADYAWDIAERKRMQAALAEERNQLAHRVEERTAELIKANTNLARALRVKDEFLANMSHELRTPLNAILGLSESLGEQIAGPLNEKQLKYITTIGESGHHLLSLINDILDLAKIEAGQITLDINKVDINAVCQASLRMVRQLAQKKSQELLLNIDPNIGLMWADERRLKQMIVNLLSNAVKFTPENGSLGLEVRAYREENRVEISVWDNGIGINENDLTQLFQPFVQLDSGLARENTGTGLGLALVSQMARLHGGSVVVLSKPGKGSRFVIKLPWEPALARDTVDRLKTTGKLGLSKTAPVTKKRILLIEDTVDVIMMIKDYLETAGYAVTTAQDGQEGISHAKLMQPDLILMDVQMPRMDGIEATQRLRSDPKFKHTPIIALTALAMPNDRERCLEAGMDEYISKPVNLKALVRIIEKFLSSGEEKTRPI